MVDYLVKLKIESRNVMCKFCTSNLHVPVETGQWTGIPGEDRMCSLCDECSYLLNAPFTKYAY